MRRLIVGIILVFSLNHPAFSQNTRLSNKNTIGWFNYFGTFKVAKKVSIHSEYQFRRNKVVSDWQQSLLRVGVNYQINTKLEARIGYAWIETAPYGEIPINGMGKDFTEHRTFQMLTLSDKINAFGLSHRFMLEQRWVGRYSSSNLSKEDEFPLLNRLRYMFRFQLPFKGKEIKNKTAYVAAYNEIFLGFGKNVNENVFDQNRVGVLIGYRFNERVRIEGGYLNQTLQLGREVGNQNVFQYNNGIIINANFNFDLSNN